MKSTQCIRILDYISQHGSITSLEAFEHLGILRLASRVHNLRHMGYPIASETVKIKNRYNETTYITKYTLEQ